MLGETEEDKYGANLNDLLHRFGVEIESATVQDYEHHYGDAPSWVLASLGDQLAGRAPAGADPLAGVDAACFYRAGVLRAENGARVIARSQPTASVPNAPLAAIVDHGAGRVVVTADSDLFGDDCIADLDHRRSGSTSSTGRLGRRSRAPSPSAPRPPRRDPEWARLQGDAVEELRLTQEPDGSVDTADARPGAAARAGRDDRRVRAGAQPTTSRTRRSTSRRSAPTSLAWVESGFAKARLRPLDGGVPARARPPRRDRAPLRLPDVQAERLDARPASRR